MRSGDGASSTAPRPRRLTHTPHAPRRSSLCRLSVADALQHPWLSGADGGDASEDADEWSEERRRFVLGIARRGRASILKTIATSLDEEAPEDIRRHRRGSSKDAVEGCTLS